MYIAGPFFVLLGLIVTTGLAEVPEFSSMRHLVKRRFCTKGKPQPRTAVKTGKRLASLRALMLKVVGGLQAYIVPSVDAHQSEYVAPEHKRRQYISGFSGSYGTAIITLQKAALWVDGRYFIQADMELDCNWILQREGIKGTPTQTQWLIQNLRKGSRVGVDPFLISICEWDRMSKELRNSGIKLVEVTRNLVDHIWKNRPKPQGAKLIVLGTNYSGKAWENKTAELRKTLKAKSATAVILHKLDEIAWLFNLRGFDIPYTPVFFSYATVTDKTIKLFVDSCKITAVVKMHLNAGKCVDANNSCVLIKPYETILNEVKHLAAQKDAKILVSPSSSHGIRMDIAKSKLLMDESPVALPKALKNPTEVAGMKNANLKDCVALCEFFAWIEQEIPKNSSHLTELEAERQLLEYRKLQKDFISPSFDTIAGFGPNSAIIHYKANSFTNAVITNESTFLLDSGGQYLDGTTDTTRTVHFGEPTEYQKDCYTRVLKGHIDIANAVFPNDTYGRTLDVFAREPLWKVGLDYRHGTGHGIGHFLNVHEGPQCISPGFPVEDEKILMAGMILSDEPAYYEDEEFGIRLETAVLVEKAHTKYHFDGLDYLKFEPVTFIPFQNKLINVSMLTKSQVDWLNRYHRKTRHVVGDELERQGKVGAPLEWLIRETEPLSYHTN